MNTKAIIACTLAGLCAAPLCAQDYDRALRQIETNSTALRAAACRAEAERAAGRTGITPPDPEVEFGYLWGDPSAVGKRIDFAVSQEFDFPTSYVHRSRMARIEAANADLRARAERLRLLLEAKLTLVEMVYRNAMTDLARRQLADATSIAELTERRMAEGTAGAIDAGKARFSLAEAQADLAEAETEQARVRTAIQRINGNRPLAFEADSFAAVVLPDDFDLWFEQARQASPAMQLLQSEVEMRRHSVRLSRSLALPRLSAGYMSEKTDDESFRGIKVGISIPLWENANRTRQAKAQAATAQAEADDALAQLYADLRSCYDRALSSLHTAAALREAADLHGNRALLRKALEAGHLSLVDYLREMQFVYQAEARTLAAERDLHAAVAELDAYSL